MVADNQASLWVYTPGHKEDEDPVNKVLKFRSSPWMPAWSYEFNCKSVPKLAVSHTKGDIWALGCPAQEARLYNGQALTSSAGSVTLFQWNPTRARARIVQTIYGKNTTDQMGTSISMSADGTTIALVASAGATAKEKRETNKSYLEVYKLHTTTTTTKNKWQPLGSTIPGITKVALSSDGTVLAAMTIGRTMKVFRYAEEGDWQEESFQTNYLRGVSSSSMALAGNGNVLSLLQKCKGGQAITIFRRVRQGRTSSYTWRVDSSIVPSTPTTRHKSSFGWVASLSGDGKRIAIAEPSHRNGSGAVHVYDYFMDRPRTSPNNKQWKPVGDPIYAIHPSKRDSLGRHLHLSQDGKQLIVKAIHYTAIYEYYEIDRRQCKEEEGTTTQVHADRDEL